MPADAKDSRTVLQAHKLRASLASDAVMHGGTAKRGHAITLRVLIISLIIAAVIVGGIVVGGYVIDLIAARRR